MPINQTGTRILTRKAIITNSIIFIEDCLNSNNIFKIRGVIEAISLEFDAITDNSFLKQIIRYFLNDKDEEILGNLSNVMAKIAKNKCPYFKDEILKYISKNLDNNKYVHLIIVFMKFQEEKRMNLF